MLLLPLSTHQTYSRRKSFAIFLKDELMNKHVKIVKLVHFFLAYASLVLVHLSLEH
jgi:hypothetical protein